MKLETLLTSDEQQNFQALVAQATQHGAQAIRWHSINSNVLVIGICAQGELLTWFASPAHDAAEADLIQTIVLRGLTLTGTALHLATQSAHALADDVIKKAAARH